MSKDLDFDTMFNYIVRCGMAVKRPAPQYPYNFYPFNHWHFYFKKYAFIASYAIDVQDQSFVYRENDRGIAFKKIGEGDWIDIWQENGLINHEYNLSAYIRFYEFIINHNITNAIRT